MPSAEPSPRVSGAFSKISDGLSNTLMLGERSWKGSLNQRCWTRGSFNDGRYTAASLNVNNPINATPYNGANIQDVSFGSQHPGGAVFATPAVADGLQCSAGTARSSRRQAGSIQKNVA